MGSTTRRLGLVLGLGAAALVATVAFAQARGPRPRNIPPGYGWFCFQDPLPTGGSTENCDRPIAACEHLRDIRRHDGEVVGDCLARPEAWCFSFTDHTEHTPTPKHYCGFAQSQCEQMRTQVAGSAPLFSDVSACAHYP